MIRCRAMCFMSLTKQMMQWNMFLIHRKNGGMHDLKKCVWIWCMRLQNWRLIFWMPGQLCSEGWTHLCFIDGSLTSTPCAHWDSRVGNFLNAWACSSLQVVSSSYSSRDLCPVCAIEAIVSIVNWAQLKNYMPVPGLDLRCMAGVVVKAGLEPTSGVYELTLCHWWC